MVGLYCCNAGAAKRDIAKRLLQFLVNYSPGQVRLFKIMHGEFVLGQRNDYARPCKMGGKKNIKKSYFSADWCRTDMPLA